MFWSGCRVRGAGIGAHAGVLALNAEALHQALRRVFGGCAHEGVVHSEVVPALGVEPGGGGKQAGHADGPLARATGTGVPLQLSQRDGTSPSK